MSASHGFDRVAEREQIADAFALAQAQVGATELGFGEGLPEGACHLRIGIAKHGRHRRVRGRSHRGDFDASAKPIAYLRLGAGALTCA